MYASDGKFNIDISLLLKMLIDCLSQLDWIVGLLIVWVIYC